MARFLALLALCTSILALPATAQDGPLRLEITEGVIEPMPFAVPAFVPGAGASGQVAEDISNLVAADLSGTGLFREIPASAHISRVTSFSSPVQFADWKAVNIEVQSGDTGTRIFIPSKSAGAVIGLTDEVVWRKPLSQIFSITTRPDFSISARS